VEVAADGRVSLTHRDQGTRVEDALRVVSEGDRGDEYNFDPVPGGAPVERPDRVRVSLGPASENEVSAVIAAKYRVPTELAPDREARARSSVTLPVTLRIRLIAGLDRLDVEGTVDNTARDHRLRLHVRAPFAARRFEVESAFEIAERPIDPPRDAFGSESPSELPVGATPQRSFATLDDGQRALTVANRGSPEVDAVPEADGTTSLAVTLLRAVGWLSRGDLRLRPGDAGPGLATPGAQVSGLHRAELSIRLHPVDSIERVSEAHRFAHPARAWIGGGPVDAPLGDRARLVEIDDPAVVVSAIEPRADRGAVLRLYNASPQPRDVSVRWNGMGARTLEPVDLIERPLPDRPIRGEKTRATLSLRPWEIVTLRIH
jgi:alpha-mannosidase